MNFSTDRDLLVYEPTLFNDVPFAAQQRIEVYDADVVGATVQSVLADFEQAQVETGHVVLINRRPHEVLQRVDDMTLTVSLLRDRTTDAAIPSGDGQALPLVMRTFAPQAAVVRQSLLHMLGIDEDLPGSLTADAVTSPATMARLESLGTLERVYSSAAALTGNNEMLLYKADHYRRRLLTAASRLPVPIDTNGDGLPDEKRYLGLSRLVRA
ncbi:MAG: hypothetical protein AAGC44_02095 [Planctomycetota bacterium]